MQAGDHLVTFRMGYTHHGLYLGNKEVIHYEAGRTHECLVFERYG